MRIPDNILSLNAAETGRYLVLEALFGLQQAQAEEPEGLYEALSDLKLLIELHDDVLVTGLRKKELRLIKQSWQAAGEFLELKEAFQLGLSLSDRKDFPALPATVRQDLRQRMRGLRQRIEDEFRPQIADLLTSLEGRSELQAASKATTKSTELRGGELLADWLRAATEGFAANVGKSRLRLKRQGLRLQSIRRLLRPWASHFGSIHIFLDSFSRLQARLARQARIRLLRELAGEALAKSLDAALAEAESEGARPEMPQDFEKLSAEIAAALRRSALTEMERERLFLLNRIPHLGQEPTIAEVYQGWLPGARVDETISRIYDGGLPRHARRVGLGLGSKRVEVEEETTEEVFESLWALTAGCRVRKRRYSLQDDERRVEIEEFHDRELFLARLVGADNAVAAGPPSWLLPAIEREVTEESHFRGRRLGI